MSIYGLLPCVWPPGMPFLAAEEEKQVSKFIGDPVRGLGVPTSRNQPLRKYVLRKSESHTQKTLLLELVRN